MADSQLHHMDGFQYHGIHAEGVDAEAPPKRSCRSCASRIMFSNAFILVYLFLTLSSCALLTWGFCSHFCAGPFSCSDNGPSVDGGLWFAVVDTVVTAVLVFEFIIRMIATIKIFFKLWLNYVDMILLVFCCVSPALEIFDYFPTRTLIFAIRYSAQALRLVLVLKHYMDLRRIVAASHGYTLDLDGPTATAILAPRADDSPIVRYSRKLRGSLSNLPEARQQQQHHHQQQQQQRLLVQQQQEQLHRALSDSAVVGSADRIEYLT